MCKDILMVVHSYAETAVEALKRKDFEVAKHLFPLEQKRFSSLSMAYKFFKNLLKQENDIPISFFKWTIEAIVQLSVDFKLSYCTKPFDMVAFVGRIDLFEILLEMAKQEKRIKLCPGPNVIHKAILKGHLSMVKFLARQNLMTSANAVARLNLQSFNLAVEYDSVPLAKWIMAQIAHFGRSLDIINSEIVKSQTMLNYISGLTDTHESELGGSIDTWKAVQSGNIELLLKAYVDQIEREALDGNEEDDPDDPDDEDLDAHRKATLNRCCLANGPDSPPTDYEYQAERYLDWGYHSVRLSIAVLASVHYDHAEPTKVSPLLLEVIQHMKKNDLVKLENLLPAIKVAVKNGMLHVLKLFKNAFKQDFKSECIEAICVAASKFGHLEIIKTFNPVDEKLMAFGVLNKEDDKHHVLCKMLLKASEANHYHIVSYLLSGIKSEQLSLIGKDLVLGAFTYNAIKVLEVLNQCVPPQSWTEAFVPGVFVYYMVKTTTLDWLYVNHRWAVDNCIQSIVNENRFKLMNWVAQRFGKEALIKVMHLVNPSSVICSIETLQLIIECPINLRKLPTLVNVENDHVPPFCHHDIPFDSIQWMCNHGLLDWSTNAEQICEDCCICAAKTQLGCEVSAFLYGFGVFKGLTSTYGQIMALRYDP